MQNFEDKFVRIPMPIIATLAPSQDTTSDQLAAFYRQPGIPFTRHSPLPVAASAPTNALINSAKKLLILLALLVCAGRTQAATNPAVIVSASSISITGASQPISITVNLIDPNNTGMLTVAGTGIVPIMRATSPTPGTTVTVGPIYGNDVILNGYGVANTTYYQVSVYTVNGGTVSSTPSLQQFYALIGSGTIDLSTATPLAPSFMSSPTGVSIPGNLSVGGTGTFFGALSALGGLTTTSFTNTGVTVLCQFNALAYVGGTCASTWGSGDIGAQMNAAGTLLPAAGGDIYLLPQTGGGCYLFTTPIVQTTVGKVIHVHAAMPASSASGTATSGACIQYTPTTATSAVTVDTTPAAGGSYTGATTWDGIAILNSSTSLGSTPCTTNGGCGSLATGITVAGTNGGAQLADWRNLSIKGFGVGMDLTGLSGIGWAPNFYNFSAAYNTTGFRTNGTEGINFYGGSISVNNTGVKLVNGGVANNMEFYGTHFDSNTALAIDGTSSGSGGMIGCHGCHFENLGTTNVAYVNLAGGAGQLALFGGEAQDDNTSGSAAAYWFTANLMNVNGLNLYANAGRAAPTSLFVITTAGYVDVVNNNPTVLTGNLGLAAWPHRIVGPGQAQESGISHIQGTQVGSTAAAWNSGGGSSSGACTVAGNDTVGQVTCLSGSSATAASGAIQLNFYKGFTGTSAVCVAYAATLTGGVNVAWPATTTFFETASPTNTTYLVGWNTNGAALTASKNYSFNYWCGGR